MPEEEKKAEKKEEKKDAKQKDEKKKDDDKIVLEARMHCESCRYKVYKAIIGYPGIVDINIDMNAQKVVLTGKADAKKLFDTVKKKSGNKITKLVSYPEPKKEEAKKEKEEKKEEKKKEPADVTVVLKVQMHCSACTKKVEKAVWKIPAVYNVKVDGEKITIKGKDLDAKKVCEEVEKKSGKHAEIVPPPKKEQEKKEGGKKDDQKEKPAAGEGGGGTDGDNKTEGKKGGGNGGSGKGGGGGNGGGNKEEKKEEKQPPRVVTEYVYAPQYFSDENPNACGIM